MKVQSLKRDELLFQKGDLSDNFYFMLRGKIEIQGESGG